MLVVANQNLAPARPVNLDGWIVGVLLRGFLVAEDQGASAGLENRPGALVIGGIESKRLRGTHPRR